MRENNKTPTLPDGKNRDSGEETAINFRTREIKSAAFPVNGWRNEVPEKSKSGHREETLFSYSPTIWLIWPYMDGNAVPVLQVPLLVHSSLFCCPPFCSFSS
jgi:hypothetical protein